VCHLATGLFGAVLRPIQTGAIAESRDVLPDPFDQSPHFDLPAQRVENTYVDFGDVRVGETVELPIEVRNPSPAVLALSSVASPRSVHPKLYARRTAFGAST